MMVLFLCGMLVLLGLLTGVQLRWIYKEEKRWLFYVLLALESIGMICVMFRYSGQFYRLEAEGWRCILLLVSTVSLLWRCFLTFSQLVSFVLKRFLHRNVAVLYLFVLSVCLTSVTAIYGYDQASRLQEVSYSIVTNKMLQEDLQFVLISDLHLGSGMNQARVDDLFERLDTKEVTAVLICGDLFDESTSSSIMRYFIEKSTASRHRGKFYYSSGNHELLQANRDAYEAWMKEAGIQFLDDETRHVNGQFCLVGRKDSKEQRRELDDLMESCVQEQPIIVMDHRPKFADSSQRPDVQISGHTHAGQVFPNTLFTKIAYPLDYGLYQEPYPMVVTSGIGTWGLPLRVGTQGELVMITMTSSRQ